MAVVYGGPVRGARRVNRLGHRDRRRAGRPRATRSSQFLVDLDGRLVAPACRPPARRPPAGRLRRSGRARRGGAVRGRRRGGRDRRHEAAPGRLRRAPRSVSGRTARSRRSSRPPGWRTPAPAWLPPRSGWTSRSSSGSRGTPACRSCPGSRSRATGGRQTRKASSQASDAFAAEAPGRRADREASLPGILRRDVDRLGPGRSRAGPRACPGLRRPGPRGALPSNSARAGGGRPGQSARAPRRSAARAR